VRLYNVKTHTWRTYKSLLERRLKPRRNHAVSWIGDKMIVYGGVDQ